MKKLLIFFIFIFSIQSFAKFIDQNDNRFIELKLKEKDIDSSLCGPVSVTNWLIDNKIIDEENGISLINLVSSKLKNENGIDVRNGLTIPDLKLFINQVSELLKIEIIPVENELYNINNLQNLKQKKLLSVLNQNQNQILLIKFMEIKRRAARNNFNPMDDYILGNMETQYSFHYVYKKGTTNDGKILIIDPEMPNKILSFKYDKNENGLYLIPSDPEAFKYVSIPNYEAQIKSIISF